MFVTNPRPCRIPPQVDRIVVTYYPATTIANAISPCVLFEGAPAHPVSRLQSVTLKFLWCITGTW